MSRLRRGCSQLQVHAEFRLKMARHRQAEGQEVVESACFRSRLPMLSKSWQFLKSQLKIEYQAKVLKAMPDTVEAQEEQFVFGRKVPTALSLEHRRLCSP